MSCARFPVILSSFAATMIFLCYLLVSNFFKLLMQRWSLFGLKRCWSSSLATPRWLVMAVGNGRYLSTVTLSGCESVLTWPRNHSVQRGTEKFSHKTAAHTHRHWVHSTWPIFLDMTLKRKEVVGMAAGLSRSIKPLAGAHSVRTKPAQSCVYQGFSESYP